MKLPYYEGKKSFKGKLIKLVVVASFYMEEYIKIWKQSIKEIEKIKIDTFSVSDDGYILRPVGELKSIDWDMETLNIFISLVISYLKNKKNFDLEKDIRDVITVSFIINGVLKNKMFG